MFRLVLIVFWLFSLSASALSAEFSPLIDHWICEGKENCFYIAMDGEITEGDVERLNKAIEFGQLVTKDAKPRAVSLNSPGGDVREAMRLGRIFRDAQIETGVAGPDSCLSACILAFVGGVSRVGLGTLGVHSFYSPEFAGTGDFDEASRRYNELAREVDDYLREMRIPRTLLDLTIRTPSSKIHVLTMKEIEEFSLLAVDPVHKNVGGD